LTGTFVAIFLLIFYFFEDILEDESNKA
jgi:hypothetical protein